MEVVEIEANHAVAILSADEKKPLMEAVEEIEADQFKEHIIRPMLTLPMFKLSKKSIIGPMLTLPMFKLSMWKFIWLVGGTMPLTARGAKADCVINFLGLILRPW